MTSGTSEADTASAPIRQMRRRAEFLAANAGARAPMPGFVLLVRPRGDGDTVIGVGFTVSRKVGNAVVRNRMKRRLRALVREVLPGGGTPGADHVLIGRNSGIERDFAMLKAEMAGALKRVQRDPRPNRHPGASRDSRRRKG